VVQHGCVRVLTWLVRGFKPSLFTKPSLDHPKTRKEAYFGVLLSIWF